MSTPTVTQPRLVEVRQKVLKRNDLLARQLRDRFQAAGVYVVSVVSSPGSGKTALLAFLLAQAERTQDQKLKASVYTRIATPETIGEFLLVPDAVAILNTWILEPPQNRADLKQRRIKAVIPPKSNRKATIRYNKRLYRERNWIERVFGHLKINRAIATRYDQLAETFLGMLFLASARYWLKFVHAA